MLIRKYKSVKTQNVFIIINLLVKTLSMKNPIDTFSSLQVNIFMPDSLIILELNRFSYS